MSLPSCWHPSCSPFYAVGFQAVLPSKLLASKLISLPLLTFKLFSLPSCRLSLRTQDGGKGWVKPEAETGQLNRRLHRKNPTYSNWSISMYSRKP
nr:hypothetical protein Iba_chr04aCG7660 [Ipomoea batatas]